MLALALTLAAAVPPEAVTYWGEVLKESVSELGLVDYKKLDVGRLDRFLAVVAELEPPKDPNEALALYVDAYNALVLRRVVEAGVPRSVLDVKGFFDAKTARVARRELTLDALEKQVIAPLAKPLHHFALVCGAVACPPLARRPYLSDPALAKMRMEAAARAYLATPRGAVIAPGALYLSKIFEWYAADFGGPAGVLAFARERLSPEAAKLLGAKPKVSSLEYDWTLNQP